MNFKILASNLWIYRTGVGLYAKDRKALTSNPNYESVVSIAYHGTKALDLNSLLPFFNRLPDIDISDQLPKIASPTLALAGENDPIVPPQQSRIIAESVPKGDMVFLKGTGHLPMFERQNEYDRALTDWVERFL